MLYKISFPLIPFFLPFFPHSPCSCYIQQTLLILHCISYKPALNSLIAMMMGISNTCWPHPTSNAVSWPLLLQPRADCGSTETPWAPWKPPEVLGVWRCKGIPQPVRNGNQWVNTFASFSLVEEFWDARCLHPVSSQGTEARITFISHSSVSAYISPIFHMPQNHLSNKLWISMSWMINFINSLGLISGKPNLEYHCSHAGLFTVSNTKACYCLSTVSLTGILPDICLVSSIPFIWWLNTFSEAYLTTC